MKHDYLINKHNSTVCGYPGRDFDWSLFCWDGSQIYKDEHNIFKHPQQAPLPFVDNFLIDLGCEYLHVPYDFVECSTIYRIRPNESMRTGKIYRGKLIIKQTAIKKNGKWYWRLKFQESEVKL